MAMIEFDLSKHADTLGDPADYFVDEHAGAYRVVRHSDGVVVGLLHPDGVILPYAQAPNPDAEPIVATLNVEADKASFQA
jgi:hypothetical protein